MRIAYLHAIPDCPYFSLVFLDEKGTMSLLGVTNSKWDQVSSFRMPRSGKGLYWPHPVVYDGRLYVRHSEQLFAYDIRKN